MVASSEGGCGLAAGVVSLFLFGVDIGKVESGSKIVSTILYDSTTKQKGGMSIQIDSEAIGRFGSFHKDLVSLEYLYNIISL